MRAFVQSQVFKCKYCGYEADRYS